MKEILADENGQGMVEYGLILGLIAVAAIAVLVVLGPKIAGIFSAANSQIPSAPAAT
ncbi:MAG: Flp family type IVb pilin [Eubacteriales bacterium]